MKVLTVGGATIDSIAVIDDSQIERMVMRNADNSFLLLEEGRKMEAEEISSYCGGGAVNAAVAMSRLGADVATLVKLGRDQRADTILTKLSDEGVSARWVKREEGAATGASVLIASHAKDAAIFTFRGANTLLKPSDLRDDMFAVDMVYISSLSNESADCFTELVTRAKAHGAKVATNPGIRQLTSRGTPFRTVLNSIDILSINQTEADALIPALVETYGEGGPSLSLDIGEEPHPLIARGFSSGGYQMTLAGFVKALSESGVGHTVVTAGAGGAFVCSPEKIIHCPGLPVEVAGTAGAGDAFASTLSLFLLMGQAPEEALRAAAINAASVIGFADSQTGLLKLAELELRLKEVGASLEPRTWEL